MLQYSGDITAMQLAAAARASLIFPMYERIAKGGVLYYPFQDLQQGRKRFVKFEWMLSQWVYVDLVDVAG